MLALGRAGSPEELLAALARAGAALVGTDCARVERGALRVPDDGDGEIAVPVLARDQRCLGVLRVAPRPGAAPFTPEERSRVAELAAVGGAVLEALDGRVREAALEVALAERAREAHLAAAIGLALTTTRSLAGRLQRCADALVQHLDVAFARIWTVEGDVLHLRASAGRYTHLDGPHGRVPVGALKIGRIAAERRPHLTNDVAHDDRISDPGWARREGMVAFAGYPLCLDDRCIGVMAMFAGRVLPESTLTALATVADTIAVGIEQAQAVERLDRRGRQFQRLATAVAEINRATDLEPILRLAGEAAQALTGADRAEAVIDPSAPPGGAEAAVVVPLRAPDGTPLGSIRITLPAARALAADDSVIVGQLAEAASAALHKARLYEERSRVVTALEQSLLPPSLPEVPGLQLAARYDAGSEEVGGDFYDAFPLGGTRWGLLIGDVKGKGPAAAATTSLARHSVRTAALLQRAPRSVLAVMNRALASSEDPERFCSAAYLRLTVGGRGARLEYASGGHPPLLVRHDDGTVEQLAPTGPLVGLFAEARYGGRRLDLRPGSVLVAYTDGITEARRGADQFGLDRLRALVDQYGPGPPDALCDAIVAAVSAFRTRDADDTAVLVVRVTATDPERPG